MATGEAEEELLWRQALRQVADGATAPQAKDGHDEGGALPPTSAYSPEGYALLPLWYRADTTLPDGTLAVYYHNVATQEVCWDPPLAAWRPSPQDYELHGHPSVQDASGDGDAATAAVEEDVCTVSSAAATLRQGPSAAPVPAPMVDA